MAVGKLCEANHAAQRAGRGTPIYACIVTILIALHCTPARVMPPTLQVLELAGPEAVQPIMRPLFKMLARCVGSTHFQVAERALFLWNNDHLLTLGILSKTYANEVLPILYTSLQKNASGHWNTTVETLAQNVIKHYMDADPGLYERCTALTTLEPAEAARLEADRKAKWERVEKMAAAAAAEGRAPASYALPISAVVAEYSPSTPSGTTNGRSKTPAPTTSTGRPLSTSTLQVLAAASTPGARVSSVV